MFWIIFLCNILIPFIMLIAGFLMWKRTPTEINPFVGYRTKRSMKNKDTWNFAHVLCGKLWFFVGLVMLPSTVLAHVPLYRASEEALDILTIILVSIQTVILISSIAFTEIALSKAFTKEGLRK